MSFPPCCKVKRTRSRLFVLASWAIGKTRMFLKEDRRSGRFASTSGQWTLNNGAPDGCFCFSFSRVQPSEEAMLNGCQSFAEFGYAQSHRLAGAGKAKQRANRDNPSHSNSALSGRSEFTHSNLSPLLTRSRHDGEFTSNFESIIHFVINPHP